ncbi:MAG: Pyruvate kinase [Myxococcaceae bacterium]|nr:Pyruvate kinase [Myxococcaceae bacterium]
MTQAQELASRVAIARELKRLESSLRELEKQMRPAMAGVAPGRLESARNLVHYVALRQHELRELQVKLSKLGLSSLGRSEACVMKSLLEVSMRANESLALRGHPGATLELARLEQAHASALSYEEASASLHRHTREILGPRPKDRHAYIMVTAPSAREANRAWMVKLLSAGMNVLRINCAHEGEAQWAQVIGELDKARNKTGKTCQVLMDLAGPKIRTGRIEGARHIAKWKPVKDEIGRVTAPARVVIHRGAPALDEGTFLFLKDTAFQRVRKGDELRLRDARDKKRTLKIYKIEAERLHGYSIEPAYVCNEARVRLFRGGKQVSTVKLHVGGAEGAAIDVRAGDTLVLTGRAVEGRQPMRDAAGRVVKPGLVACTLSAALDRLEPGHRVVFDDGRIHAVVDAARNKAGDFLLRVVRTQKETIKLRAEKGINLPDTLTTVSSLSPDDLKALAFVAKHADAVSLSFVRTPEDVRALHQHLKKLDNPHLGIVLKIETRVGFENLPRLLLEGLRRPPLAVMIARGDLAVEVGFERLAELQEEILWLCEATHVPAIWATQVLDTLARTGVPSRAEVTDAAAGVAAECVMLNKGPFVHEAVKVLSDILRRMEKHRDKKRSLFRKLNVSTFAER